MITKSWFDFPYYVIIDDFLSKLLVLVLIALIFKDKLIVFSWVEYGKTNHMIDKFRRHSVSLEGLLSNMNWIQPGRADFITGGLIF